MNNTLKTNSPFYTLIKFKEYKNISFAFFIFIVTPILIIRSFLVSQFNFPINYPVSALLYITMFLFINSFIVLYGLAGGKRISFSQVLKFIPSIIPIIILPILTFSILLIIAHNFFLIAAFLLFAFIPIVSFAPLYNKNISIPEIIDNNKKFQKTPLGKKLLKNLIVLSVIMVIILFFLEGLILGTFGFSSNNIIFSISQIILSLLNTLSFFIIYITIVNTYSIYSFILPDNLYKIADNIISETKNTRKKRNISSKKHSHKKESYKENVFDFEKEDNKKPESKERNRFLEDEGYNRFEDTKF